MNEEHGNEFVGTLFVLPESRHFELKTSMHGAPVTLTGTISQQLAAQFHGHDDSPHIDPRELALHPRRVEIMTREIHERHRASRKVNFLVRLLDGGEGKADQPLPAAS